MTQQIARHFSPSAAALHSISARFQVQVGSAAAAVPSRCGEAHAPPAARAREASAKAQGAGDVRAAEPAAPHCGCSAFKYRACSSANRPHACQHVQEWPASAGAFRTHDYEGQLTGAWSPDAAGISTRNAFQAVMPLCVERHDRHDVARKASGILQQGDPGLLRMAACECKL